MKKLINLLQMDMAMPITGIIMSLFLLTLCAYEPKHLDMMYRLSAESKKMVYVSEDFGNGIIARYLILHNQTSSYGAKVQYDPYVEHHGISSRTALRSRAVYRALSILTVIGLSSFIISLFFLVSKPDELAPG